ncbi:tyrosine-type recombinase/integrase [Planctomycetota bacterium]
MIQRYHNHWSIDASQILSKTEITLIIDDLKRKGRRSVSAKLNLVLFRLATCAGCRASEIAGLKLQDLKLSVEKPYIYISKAIGKGAKSRKIPAWWDRSTLDDLIAWKAERQAQGAKGSDYYICSQAKRSFGKPLTRANVRNHFITACKVLGPERLIIGRECFSPRSTKAGQFYTKHLTIHCGRHSFCSHALAGGRSLVEVKEAAGHSNISTSSIYLHITGDDDGSVGDLFDFSKTG